MGARKSNVENAVRDNTTSPSSEVRAPSKVKGAQSKKVSVSPKISVDLDSSVVASSVKPKKILVKKELPDNPVTSRTSSKLKVKRIVKNLSVPKVPMSSVYATGRRKVALAKVWLWSANAGEVAHSINGMPGLSYFSSSPSYAHIATMPFSVVGADINEYSFRVDVCGGGKSGQSDALRHAFARAILKLIPSLSALLRDAKMLTRDSRMVQPKNVGKRKARKSEQYSKR